MYRCENCSTQYVPDHVGLLCHCGGKVREYDSLGIVPHHEEKLGPAAAVAKQLRERMWSTVERDAMTILNKPLTFIPDRALPTLPPPDKLPEKVINPDRYDHVLLELDNTKRELDELRDKSTRNLDDLFTREQYEAVCRERDQLRDEVNKQAERVAFMEEGLGNSRRREHDARMQRNDLELWARRHGWKG